MTGEVTSDPEIYLRDEDMVYRKLGEEMVLVPIRRGIGDFDSFYILNESGGVLWDFLSEPRSQAELIAHLISCFEVSEEEAREDVAGFLAELQRLKAIKQGAQVKIQSGKEARSA